MGYYSNLLQQDYLTLFLFHGVIPVGYNSLLQNYNRKHLSDVYFEDVIKEIRVSGTPLHFSDAINYLKRGSPFPPNAFVVTFDDGFQNNVDFALPILEKYEVPSIIYVTTIFSAEQNSSWIDIIEYATESLDIVEIPYSPLYPFCQGTYRSLEEKRFLLDLIRNEVKSNPNIDPITFADYFRNVTDSMNAYPQSPILDQKISPEVLTKLVKHPLVEIGGHSHTHRILGFLSSEEQQYEISSSIALLRKWTNQDVLHYSYPEGTPNSYNKKTIDILRSHGIVTASTTDKGYNSVETDLFQLRRYTVT